MGFNLASALTKLGNQVDFASLIGEDDKGFLVRKALGVEGVGDGLVLEGVSATAQSVILYDPGGRRQIHVDLKDFQNQGYPTEIAEKALRECDLAVVCNINFARPILKVAQKAGTPIATDVHALADLDDDFNRDYMAAAKILFLSDESLPDSPENFAQMLLDKYPCEILVIGLGANGALLAVRGDHFIGRFQAVTTRSVVNTIGAGDALFSAFLDGFLRSRNPYDALRRAMVFASYKIGEKGAAEGFLSGEALDDWVKQVYRSHVQV
ncbi:MAG: carbohydrate kinase family protein [Chloroflexota bacterium]|nr:carbohydrate kinase family protein [Chloroflexota bacterium]